MDIEKQPPADKNNGDSAGKNNAPEIIVRSTPHLVIAIGKIGNSISSFFPREERKKFHLITASFPEQVRLLQPDPVTDDRWDEIHFDGGIKSFEKFCFDPNLPECTNRQRTEGEFRCDVMRHFPMNLMIMIYEASSTTVVASLDNNICNPMSLYEITDLAIHVGRRLRTFIVYREIREGDAILAENIQWTMENISIPENEIKTFVLPSTFAKSEAVENDPEFPSDILHSIVESIRSQDQVTIAPQIDDKTQQPGLSKQTPVFELVKMQDAINTELKWVAQQANLEKMAPDASNEFAIDEPFIPHFENADLVILGDLPLWNHTHGILRDLSKHYSLKLNLGVLFISKWGARDLAIRFLREMNVDYMTMLTGETSDEEWDRLLTCRERFSKANMFHATAPQLTLELLRETITRCIRRLETVPLGLILIDHLQSLKLTDESNSMTLDDEISQITRELKYLARDLKVPVVCTSDLPFPLEDKTGSVILPQLSELKSIAESADLICIPFDSNFDFLQQKYAYGSEIFVVKNNHGSVGIKKL
ncbi:MAG: hypothetical protein HQM09_14695 [Candidatus Riflebacteria bacterium]|nr:hypothetical protein [Candidatus Riflebacteria bacterium]